MNKTLLSTLIITLLVVYNTSAQKSIPEEVRDLKQSVQNLNKVQNAEFIADDISLKDNLGNEITRIGISEKGGNGYVYVYRNNSVVSSFTSGLNGGYSKYFTTSKIQSAYLGVSAKGAGLLEVYDINGALVSATGSTEYGGYGRFYNSSKKQVAYLGASTLGSGFLELHDNYGIAKVQVSVNGNGYGQIRVNGVAVHDYAEVFELADRDGIEEGVVVSMTENGIGLRPTNESYDPKVVGVISGAGGLVSGMTIGSRKDETKDYPVAVSGQVYVRTSGEGGNVKVGDLLVSSSRPGLAMKSSDSSKAFGAVIGKVLEPKNFQSKKDIQLVRILVMTR